jgi:hypothetical protein
VAVQYAKDPYNTRDSCIPCQYGEHVNCRHAMDGPRFTRDHPKGTCKCENANHPPATGCRANIAAGYDSSQCDRPIKGEWEERCTFGSIHDHGTYMRPLCGVHLGARRRRATNDLVRKAQWEAERREWDRDDENERVAQDYVAKLLAEFGLKTEVAKVNGRHTGAVAIQGETLFGLMTELRTWRYEMGIND